MDKHKHSNEHAFFYLVQKKRPQLEATFSAIKCSQNSYKNLPAYIQLNLANINQEEKKHNFLNFFMLLIRGGLKIWRIKPVKT